MNMYKTPWIATAVFIACLGATWAGPYQADWDSLSKHDDAPEWFRDAKLGIYFHWGVYAVPAFGSEWYPRNMYNRDSSLFEHHKETWGDQFEFGYKAGIDFSAMRHFECGFDIEVRYLKADAWNALAATATTTAGR